MNPKGTLRDEVGNLWMLTSVPQEFLDAALEYHKQTGSYPHSDLERIVVGVKLPYSYGCCCCRGENPHCSGTAAGDVAAVVFAREGGINHFTGGIYCTQVEAALLQLAVRSEFP